MLVLQLYRLDASAFALLLIIAAVVSHAWLRRRLGLGIQRVGWAAVIALVVVGFAAPEIAGERQRASLRDMIAGIAPTYAGELQRLGHSKLTADTSEEDPSYLAMIAAERRWLAANPTVADIYTLRRAGDGSVVFLVDSETDYNRDGKIEGEREERTRIGEIYEDITEAMTLTFEGGLGFDDVPMTDRWGTWVSAYVPLYDADGRVDAIVGVDYDAHEWVTSIGMSRIAALGFVAVIGVILLASLMVVVISRAQLEQQKAAEHEREKMQQQLLAASRQAGMAEVATSVLHNVGNVLNSVNVSAGVIRENVQKSKVGALAKATAMLQEHRQDLGDYVTRDDRGKLLPDYLHKLSDVLRAEHQSVEGELASLIRSVDHIKQIVAAQQTLAKNVDERSEFEFKALVDDAMRMMTATGGADELDVVQSIDGVERIMADRHKLLQVLVNLLSNARNAVKNNVGRRRIELRAAVGGQGKQTLTISVKDNGMGIPPENLSRIFTHGFTTRKDGHGFGLHSSANAVQQMKGKLQVASEGAGQGATFTVEIPLASAEAKLI